MLYAYYICVYIEYINIRSCFPPFLTVREDCLQFLIQSFTLALKLRLYSP